MAIRAPDGAKNEMGKRWEFSTFTGYLIILVFGGLYWVLFGIFYFFEVQKKMFDLHGPFDGAISSVVNCKFKMYGLIICSFQSITESREWFPK